MNALIPTIRTLRFAALAAVLLCAQALALSHGVEHTTHEDHEVCAPCAIAAGVKHLASAMEVTVPVVPELVAIEADHTPLLTDLAAPRTTARAPPVHS